MSATHTTHEQKLGRRAARRATVLLVALDGSPAAATAMPVARVLAAQLNASVEILHVAAAAAPVPTAGLRRRLDLEREGLGALRVRAAAGDPAARILAAIEESTVSLVVLTTHGRVIEPGRQLGRVAEAVIAGTTRPVLLVRPEAIGWAEAHPNGLRRLLLPLDGTPTTAAALAPAGVMAGRLGTAVDLLYVASAHQAPPGERGSLGAPRYVDQPYHEWPQWADEVSARLRVSAAAWPPDVPVRVFLRGGAIGDEITRFAAERGSDVVVLVRRSRLEPGHAPVLRAVLDRTPCPVLLVGDGSA